MGSGAPRKGQQGAPGWTNRLKNGAVAFRCSLSLNTRKGKVNVQVFEISAAFKHVFNGLDAENKKYDLIVACNAPFFSKQNQEKSETEPS